MKGFIIVDDEVLVRVGIRSLLDWEAVGYTVMGEAIDGEEAWRLIEAQHPDLVLTDLAMPVCDGFALIDRIRSAKLPIGIVVLSCHNDFENVREALRRGADDYIFKLTLNRDELLTVFSRVLEKRETHSGRDEPVTEDDPRPKLGQAQPLSVPENGAYRIMALVFVGLEASADILRELKRRDMSILSVEFLGTKARLVLANGGKQGFDATFRWIKEYAERYLGSGVLGAVSSLGTHPDQAEALIAEAETLVTRECFGPGRDLAFAEDVQVDEAVFHRDIYAAACSALAKAVELGDTGGIASSLMKISTSLRLPLEMDRLRSLLSDAVVPFKVRCYALGIDPEALDGAEPFSIIIPSSLSVRSAVERLIRFGERFVSRMEAETKLRKEIFEVRRWILTDLSRRFTVEAAAEVAGMSLSHFAHVFKEETGASFIEYVNACRMDRARDLLLTTDLRIKEIADRLGFENANYFTTLFKRQFGMSPNEQRAIILPPRF